MKRHDSVSTTDLIRYAEGEVTRSEADEIEGLLKESSRDKSRLDDLHALMGQLANVDELPDPAIFVAGVRDRIERTQPVRQPRSNRKKILTTVTGLAACSLLALALITFGRVSDEATEFQAKRADVTGNARERWIGLTAYRISTDGVPSPLGDTMDAGDGLLFSYTNLGQSPFQYLMVFAVDEEGEIFWYYPAYMAEGTNPVSIPIRPGVLNFELTDKVVHSFREGSISIVGLFSDQLLGVLEVEREVGDLVDSGRWHVDQPFRLSHKHTGQKIIQTRILR